MAKKKAAQKKAPKKKVAKKKTAKKKTQKKPKSLTLKYKCSNGCKASKKFAHMSPGDSVSLVATNTVATIDFLTGTPFASGDVHIVVRPSTPVREVVARGARGTYEYTLSCDSCKSSVSNPKMIVP
jgi:hypothetical protein